MTVLLKRCLAAALIAVGVLACGAQQPVKRTAAPTGKAAVWFDLSAESFFARQAAQKRLDARQMDQTLLAAAIFHETNVRRQRAGKSILQHDARLDEAALGHAGSMVRRRFFDHTNPYQTGLRTPRDRAIQAGFTPRYISENIATHFDLQYKSGTPFYKVPEQKGGGFSYTPGGPAIARHTYHSFAASLLDQWMASSGHRGNILSRYPTVFGAGCAVAPESSGMDKLYCVQLFGAAME